MKVDKLSIAILALSIALGVSFINSYYVVNSLSQPNQTELAIEEILEERGEPQDLPTGQESVPVITANNTDLAQVAPAEAVTSLLNWITISFIPAIIGLILAITTLLKLLPMSKRTKAGIEKGEKALVYVDTLAPKVSKQFFANGASTNAIEFDPKPVRPSQAGFESRDRKGNEIQGARIRSARQGIRRTDKAIKTKIVGDRKSR